MAIFLAGPIASDIRGSIGGTVFSRNGSGAIMRARVKPVQPNTAAQNRAKTFFGAANASWNNGDVSAVQRTAWRAYASAVKWLNALGGVITLAGNSVFNQSATARLTAGLPVIFDGPTTLTQGQMDAVFEVEADEAGQLLTVTFDDTREWAANDLGGMSIFMGQPQNAGANSFSGPYTLAGALLGNTAVPITSPLTVAAPFVVVEGQRITARARICESDGRVSKYFQHTSDAVA